LSLSSPIGTSRSRPSIARPFTVVVAPRQRKPTSNRPRNEQRHFDC
jgi:hypothetical protein